MSANINLRNIHINRDTRILNSSTVTGSTSISLDDITIGGKAVILENLNITDFCNKAQEQSSQMSNSERESIQNVIAHQGHTNFLKLLAQHLLTFTEGVTASIVANCLSR